MTNFFKFAGSLIHEFDVGSSQQPVQLPTRQGGLPSQGRHYLRGLPQVVDAECSLHVRLLSRSPADVHVC